MSGGKRIFITGSTDGLGLLAAKRLTDQGHMVALHARSKARADEVRSDLPANLGTVTGDLSSIEQTNTVAEQVNDIGRFDAVIHNAGVYLRGERRETEDGLSDVFAINVLAPYILTALIDRPQRLIYITSGLHRSGQTTLDDPQFDDRAWQGSQAYSDSKLHVTTLALFVAAAWPDVASNAVNPGWVPTRMGGTGAPDDLELGADTQVWLAAGEDASAKLSGRYLHHRQASDPPAATRSADLQKQLADYCEQLSGVKILI